MHRVKKARAVSQPFHRRVEQESRVDESVELSGDISDGHVGPGAVRLIIKTHPGLAPAVQDLCHQRSHLRPGGDQLWPAGFEATAEAGLVAWHLGRGGQKGLAC